MSSQIPQCSADMKSLRKGVSSRRSRSASQDYDVDLEDVLAAINELNGLPRHKLCSLLGTSYPERAHCLPHSDHRTLRQHKYLYYAGLVSRAGSKSQQQLKGSVQNISWLHQNLHTRMDRRDAFVWMGELDQVIESCELHLAAIEQNGGHGFETFESSSFLQDWSNQISMPVGRNVALYRYQPWILPRQTIEGQQDDVSALSGADLGFYLLKEQHRVFPSLAPFKYTPALSSRLLSLDPFIATLMAMTTLERRPDYDSITFDEEASVMLKRAEYLLELCEVDTPSSWRTLARPPLSSSLPPPSSATPPCLQRRLFPTWPERNSDDSNERTPTPDCLDEDLTQEELEAKLERFEAACEAKRRAYLEDCSTIIERHFRADCDVRGFSLAMRSLRSTAKHPADDELAARHEEQEEQEKCFRKRHNELNDAICDLLY